MFIAHWILVSFTVYIVHVHIAKRQIQTICSGWNRWDKHFKLLCCKSTHDHWWPLSLFSLLIFCWLFIYRLFSDWNWFVQCTVWLFIVDSAMHLMSMIVFMCQLSYRTILSMFKHLKLSKFRKFHREKLSKPRKKCSCILKIKHFLSNLMK